MGNKTINQHYVPRMYLKRFALDQKRLCVWDLKNDALRTRQRLENYAARRYFYDTSEAELMQALGEIVDLYPEILPMIDTTDEQFVEKALSRMEADVSSILDLVTNKHEALFDETNMKKLIIFLHDLAYRSEAYRESLDDIREHLIIELGKMGIEPAQVENLDKTGKEDQLYRLLGIAPLLRTAKGLVENYNWYIGIVPGAMKLVVSDNPAQGVRLGFNDICIPLCGEKAIILRTINSDAPIISKDMPKGKEIYLTERSVFAYNAIQLSYANRFVFGDKTSISLLKSMSDKRGGYKKLYGEKPI